MPKFTFLLKAGKHVGPDHTQEPVERVLKDIRGNETREWRYPSKTYSKGDKIQTDQNLLARHGGEKFQLLSDKGQEDTRLARLNKQVKTPVPHPSGALREQRAAPAGQVSDGHQQTNHTDDGGQISGVAVEEVIRALKAENEALRKQAAQKKDDSSPTGKSIMEEFADPDADQGSEAEDDEDAELEGLTAAELKSLAEDEEVELHGAKSKKDMVKAIKDHRSGKAKRSGDETEGTEDEE